ncbi:MAG: lysylphosphatidylglycerol synthase transmembrane domain-containing protein [Solirubrobacteraceae bacterium]
MGAVLLAALAVVLVRIAPQIVSSGSTLRRLRHGDAGWLAFGVGAEMLSIGGYILLFKGVFSCHGVRIGWRASYEITMAGTVATRLSGAGGAGGLALTGWALTASGLRPATVAKRLVAFNVLLYFVYMVALIVFGVLLGAGLISGPSPWSVTLLPAALAVVVIVLVLSMRLLPDDLERRLTSIAHGSRRGRKLLSRVATVPRALHDGGVVALEQIRQGRPLLLGAPAYWAFDVLALWVGFKAFGATPPVAVVVMAYFVGTLANVLPIPGGVGGVEGGMIGAFLAFGVSAPSAVLAVLTYRALSFALPLLPGGVAYWQLRHTVAVWRERYGDDRAGPAGPQPAPS